MTTNEDRDSRRAAPRAAGDAAETADLTPAEIAGYGARLEQRREELERRLDRIEHDLDAPAPNDFEDRATEREGDEVLEGLGVSGLAELRQVRAALARIEAGGFGACGKCGETISRERLDAVPHAALCRRCA